jgi:hypothetical protein
MGLEVMGSQGGTKEMVLLLTVFVLVTLAGLHSGGLHIWRTYSACEMGYTRYLSRQGATGRSGEYPVR